MKLDFHLCGSWSRKDKLLLLVWAVIMVLVTLAALLFRWSINVHIVAYVVVTLACSSVEFIDYVKARHYGAALFWLIWMVGIFSTLQLVEF